MSLRYTRAFSINLTCKDENEKIVKSRSKQCLVSIGRIDRTFHRRHGDFSMMGTHTKHAKILFSCANFQTRYVHWLKHKER